MRTQTDRQVTDFAQDQRPGEEAGAESGISLNDLVRMLLRHKWFIVIWLVVCTSIAYLDVKTSVPIYQASATIRIDPTRAGSVGLGDLVPSAPYVDVGTEIAMMKSDAVAISTLDSLSPEEFREFTGGDKATLAIPPGALKLTPRQEGILGAMKGGITGTAVEGTQLVAISFRSPDPQLAATIVNHAIAAYLRASFDSHTGTVTQVSQWLSAEMNTLQDKATEAQHRLAAFQEKNDILSSDMAGGSGATSSGTTTRLQQLNAQLTDAESKRIVQEAQMRTAEAGSAAVVATLIPSAQLTGLLSEQSSLSAQYARLSSKFGPNYPQLIELKRDMQKVDADIAQAVGTNRARMRQDYESSLQAESMLRQEYDKERQKAYALNREQADYAVLLAESHSSRELYDTLQYKLEAAGVDAGLNGINTTLVDNARAPLSPIAPKKTQIMGFGVIIGLFAGVATAFLREALSDKVQSVEQVERIIGYHNLATIPHLTYTAAAEGGGMRSRASMLVTQRDPLSRDAEAYRTLRNSMLLTSIDNPAKTVLITSTLPSEGKSLTSSNYAVVLAQNGARVLLIDADLRRPTLHKAFSLENTVGLSNLILGEEAQVPFRTPIAELPGLAVLTAGKKVPLPSEALGSTRFYSLLKDWEKQFDYVIIDSAPLLIVSDSLPLASWVDALILVSRYNATPLSALRRIRDILNRTNANVAGFIINDVSGVGTEYGGYGYAYYN